jgi:FixJ family two-component response regulator
VADRLTLAVVEDDEDVRTALDRLLRAMGHDVRLFASAEAFDGDLGDLDCVILDIRLPGLSGLELGDRIRRRASRLPVVFITGGTDPSVRDGAGTAERIDPPALTKPFSDHELIDAVTRAMRQARQPGDARMSPSTTARQS